MNSDKPLGKVNDSGIGGATVGCCATEKSAAADRTTDKAASEAVARSKALLIAALDATHSAYCAAARGHQFRYGCEGVSGK